MWWKAIPLALLFHCGGSTLPPQPTQPLPQFVTVDVVSVTIAPGKVDGTTWDGIGQVPKSDWQALRLALASVTPYAAVVTLFAEWANRGWEKPDVRGNVVLLGPQPEQRVLPKIPDNFEPSWNGAASFAHVPTGDPRLRVRVQLTDVDAVNDDPIGVVELSMPMLLPALEKGGIHRVQVSDQAPQILFVGVSVRPE